MVLEIILAIVVFLNLVLSFFVISQNPKSSTNRFFALLSFLAGLWTFTNFMTGVQAIPFWLDSTYATGALVLAAGLIWTLIIINDASYKMKAILILIIAIIFSFCSYVPNFIAGEYDQIYIGGVFTGSPGFGLAIYTIFYLIGAFFILWMLFNARRKSNNFEKRKQFELIFYGGLITLVISALTSFIFPVFSIFTFSGLDSLGFLFFLAFIAYAITKEHLFDIKVITTELIVFSLWIFILIRAFIAEDLQGTLVEIGLLIVTVIVGILLIKSVLKEVEQREHIEKLASDLQKANARLTELDRQKSEFVSFATHQLRAPLTAIKGYASLMMEGDTGEITLATRQAVSRIFDSADSLTNMVNDYLDITRIELGTMKYAFDTIDLKQLVEDVIAELKPTIQSSKPKFSFTAEDHGITYRITADKNKLKQVIANLIDNSFKYTPSGEVKVTLGFDKTRHKYVLAIKDTGIGIAPETLPLLFQKFTRAGNANKTNIKGTGLGLYVAKEIITSHHGEIRVTSPGEGKGSTFTVELDPFMKAA